MTSLNIHADSLSHVKRVWCCSEQSKLQALLSDDDQYILFKSYFLIIVSFFLSFFPRIYIASTGSWRLYLLSQNGVPLAVSPLKNGQHILSSLEKLMVLGEFSYPKMWNLSVFFAFIPDMEIAQTILIRRSQLFPAPPFFVNLSVLTFFLSPSIVISIPTSLHISATFHRSLQVL